MSSHTEQYPLSDEQDPEAGRVARWRLEQFEALGFDPDDASMLAVSDADLQGARTLLGAGCSHRLALKILL
jgi:hypothetical protein